MTDHEWLAIDYESRSTVDLKKSGAYRYWEDDTTSPWGMAFAFDDAEPEIWMPGEDLPVAVVRHVERGGKVSAWNAPFEWCGWNIHCAPKLGWPKLEWDQLHDTAAWAAAMNLPRGLGDAALALGMPFQKDMEGHRLMMQMAKPRRPRKGEDPSLLRWWDEPEKIDRLMRQYCPQDVKVERAIKGLLVPLSQSEREIWLMDQRMNERGVTIDLALVDRLQEIVDVAKDRLDTRIREITGDKAMSTTTVARLTEWIAFRGVSVSGLAKDAIEEYLAMDLPPDVREVIEIRKEAAKSSTAKLATMRSATCKDGKARHLHLYHGASTGRWSGRLIQTQNMPRGTGVIKDPERAMNLLMTGDAAAVELVYGPAMSAVSDSLRACLKSSTAHRLLAADYSSIEGRVTAWVAGETWKLEAFRAADAKTGSGMYELTASLIFDCPVNEIGKKDQRRQVGKVAELALGFQGGVMAFDNMARVYGLDMAIAYDPLMGSAGQDVIEKAKERYEECLKKREQGTDVLSRKAWIASEITKVVWRQRHPATQAFWYAIEDAVIKAVKEPGAIASCPGGISWIVKRGFLWCMLPSRRCLAYASPVLKVVKTPWGAERHAVSVMGVDSTTKQWRRYDLYGGILTENVVQAIARDLMANGMLLASNAGYPVIMTIHDEAVADVPVGFGSLKEYEGLLCTLPDWAAGIPLTAEGYEALRYKKD